MVGSRFSKVVFRARRSITRASGFDGATVVNAGQDRFQFQSTKGRKDMPTITTKDGVDFLQGLGARTADCVRPWLASVGRRLERADAVLPEPRFPRHRA